MLKPHLDLNSMTYTASDGSVHDVLAYPTFPELPQTLYWVTGTIIMIDHETGLAAIRNGTRISILKTSRQTTETLRHGQHVSVAYTPGLSDDGADGAIAHVTQNPATPSPVQEQTAGSTSWTRVDRVGDCDRCQHNKHLRWHSPSGIQHLTICSDCMEQGPIAHARNITITPVHMPGPHDTRCRSNDCHL